MTGTSSESKRTALARRVEKIVANTPVFDIHTHLYDPFWALPRTRQTELIWNALFVQHSPLSEACRGVLTTLKLLGIDARKRDLPPLRRWFSKQSVEKHLTRCLELAKVE